MFCYQYFSYTLSFRGLTSNIWILNQCTNTNFSFVDKVLDHFFIPFGNQISYHCQIVLLSPLTTLRFFALAIFCLTLFITLSCDTTSPFSI
ncbi:MAG: hypothetical protein JWO03_3542 [Bacteroidetes bacterium]|nr:hypothetical protein [Bacteroidota bacterium]